MRKIISGFAHFIQLWNAVKNDIVALSEGKHCPNASKSNGSSVTVSI